MKKYDIYAVYTGTRYCGQVEAESEAEAIDKAFEQDLIEGDVNFCWHCSRDTGIDELLLDDDAIFAEEV